MATSAPALAAFARARAAAQGIIATDDTRDWLQVIDWLLHTLRPIVGGATMDRLSFYRHVGSFRRQEHKDLYYASVPEANDAAVNCLISSPINACRDNRVNLFLSCSEIGDPVPAQNTWHCVAVVKSGPNYTIFTSYTNFHPTAAQPVARLGQVRGQGVLHYGLRRRHPNIFHNPQRVKVIQPVQQDRGTLRCIRAALLFTIGIIEQVVQGNLAPGQAIQPRQGEERFYLRP